MMRLLVAITLAGFALGAAVMAIGNRRTTPDGARARWLKLVVFFLIVVVLLAAATAGHAWVMAALAAILLAATLELAVAWRQIPAPRPAIVWPVYLAGVALALSSAARMPAEGFAFLFLAAAAGDGFSQVVGQWLGRIPLAPRVSPAKTVEGLLGGLCAAAAVATLLAGLVGIGRAQAAVLGLGVGLSGLAGDLAASWVKRRAGIKDYSNALPGQGGFLDRFDSLIGALAIAAWWL